ncbi:MAG: hypothetical protein ACP5VQ_01895 [Phycisphaerae bacterium]
MAKNKIVQSVCWSMAVFGVLLFTATGITVRAAVKKPYPTPNMLHHGWQLTFVWHKPQRVYVAVGHGIHRNLREYWFMRYTVINNTHRDIFFIPSFVLVTDTGKVLRPVTGLSPRVLVKIRTVTGDPFIISPGLIAGKLLQGADNAKDGVAVFTRVPSQTRQFKIFVSGLSADTALQENPLTHKTVVLHKTLLLKFWIPGQSVRMLPQPQFQGKQWVMR